MVVLYGHSTLLYVWNTSHRAAECFIPHSAAECCLLHNATERFVPLCHSALYSAQCHRVLCFAQSHSFMPHSTTESCCTQNQRVPYFARGCRVLCFTLGYGLVHSPQRHRVLKSTYCRPLPCPTRHRVLCSAHCHSVPYHQLIQRSRALCKIQRRQIGQKGRQADWQTAILASQMVQDQF